MAHNDSTKFIIFKKIVQLPHINSPTNTIPLAGRLGRDKVVDSDALCIAFLERDVVRIGAVIVESDNARCGTNDTVF